MARDLVPAASTYSQRSGGPADGILGWAYYYHQAKHWHA